MNRTPIEWTDFSANPLRYRAPDGRVVWACVKTSAGCTNCYAEQLSHRYGGSRRAGDWNAAVMATLTPFLDEKELRHMLTAKRIGGKDVAGSKCFPFDMTDLFGEWVPDELLDRLFAVFALRPDVTWQVLTKRAERMRDYVSSKHCLWRGFPDFVGPTISTHDQVEAWCKENGVPRAERERRLGIINNGGGFEYGKYQGWPLPNVWLGVSTENQEQADTRIPLLLQTPAAVRFISAEPLLGPVNLADFMFGYCSECGCRRDACDGLRPQRACCPDCRHRSVDWVIVGGENGPRPFDIAWARAILAQCKAAGVAAFMKQIGTVPYDGIVCLNDGVLTKLRDRKGGDPSEWDADLRVREFPAVPR